MNRELLEKNLCHRGFAFSYFETKEAARDYLNEKIDGTTVGIGGSMTVNAMGLYDALKSHNEDVSWHMVPEGDIDRSAKAKVYISSLNGLSENGELINIDGIGNRVSATAYGAKRVYFVVGQNKVAEDYDKALWRARNIAAPKNAVRLGAKTPCALKEPRCYDCSSPDRLCRELLVLWTKPRTVEEMEIVLIGEDLGY